MPRPPSPPTSLVGVPLAVRPGGNVQIGSSPRTGSVVGPLSAADLEAFARWGRSPDTRDDAVRAEGARVVGGLVRAGALAPGRVSADAAHLTGSPAGAPFAPDAAAWAAYDPDGLPGGARWATRGRRSVAVVGCGRTGTGLLRVLAAGGVGRLTAADDEVVDRVDLGPLAHRDADLGARRADAALGRVRPGGDDGDAGPDGPADLVVVVDHHVARAGRADGLVADGVAHLSVVVRDTDALVGPLVLPGRTPCLRCLDLHRSDADPDWPAVLDQFAARPAGPAGLVLPEETATATVLAGLVALQAFTYLDGGTPSSLGATLELLLPEGIVQQRRWAPHPQCGCADLPVPLAV